ncbi:hypothetical protein G0Q02_17560 [Epibacterium mobile]|nr:hypothetical protein [Tritonibacter mobilis]NHM24670.1 hypothetical protein [Tritonibacter mobilis]
MFWASIPWSLPGFSTGAAGYVVWSNGILRENLGTAQRMLAVKDREIANAREAAEVLDAHLSRMEQEQQDLNATLQFLRNREGYDARLSDFLRDAFDRM